MVTYRLSLLVCLLFGLIAFVNAQSEPSTEWKLLHPDGEIFTVEIPATIKTDFSLDKTRKRFYSASDGTFFAIFSEKLGRQADCLKALGFVHNYEPSVSQITIGSIQAEHYVFNDGDGFKHEVLSFTTYQRAYIFHAISRADSASANRFFSSLKINNTSAIKVVPNEPTSKAALPEQSSASISKNIGQPPQGSGYGSGNGNGPGPSTRNEPAKVAAITTPLNILSKPRAEYTDLASLYWIHGSVILKVTLLSTGQIGSITPVTRLPFGLTQKAITAARSIQFEPKKVNGVPVSVIKTIEYNFNIY